MSTVEHLYNLFIKYGPQKYFFFLCLQSPILNCPKPHWGLCLHSPSPMLFLSSQIPIACIPHAIIILTDTPPGHAIIILTDTCCPLVISYPHRYDASLIEINPLAELTDGRVLCLDCKINFDDNAEYRHKELFQKRDLTQVRVSLMSPLSQV